jgi:enoyl-CoA hydratase/long-chain 3-hydroxyacyl-CoA dehydrogenase
VKPQNIGVLGAGLMGAGIATVSINKAGHKVVLKDTTNAALQRGQQQIYDVIHGGVKKRKITAFERDVKLSKLTPTLDYEGFKDADIVIEAVIEDLKVKHKVLQEIEAVTRPDCIFATNTSAIAISSIAAGSKRPENVIGMHYFSPVDKMPLLEVVMGEKTSKEAGSKAVAVGLKQGKVVITVKDAPAFYTTRVLSFMIAELIHLLLEGNQPKDLDKMSKRMGFPVGLVTLLDEVGMDTGLHIQNYLRPIFGHRLSPHDNTAYAELVSQGHTGRKAGKGFYLYDGKKKGDREVNPKVDELLKKYSKAPKRV